MLLLCGVVVIILNLINLIDILCVVEGFVWFFINCKWDKGFVMFCFFGKYLILNLKGCSFRIYCLVFVYSFDLF